MSSRQPRMPKLVPSSQKQQTVLCTQHTQYMTRAQYWYNHMIGTKPVPKTPTKSTTPSEACLDNGAHLVAAICKFYKLGRPTWGKNIFGHKDFSATCCLQPAALKLIAARYGVSV